VEHGLAPRSDADVLVGGASQVQTGANRSLLIARADGTVACGAESVCRTSSLVCHLLAASGPSIRRGGFHIRRLASRNMAAHNRFRRTPTDRARDFNAWQRLSSRPLPAAVESVAPPPLRPASAKRLVHVPKPADSLVNAGITGKPNTKWSNRFQSIGPDSATARADNQSPV
jgi:hypothetical protein